MNRGQLTEAYGKKIVEQLLLLGVDTFYLAPGLRATPIALALAESPLANTHIHFDERGIAFRALGYAKASGKPACVVVTSGTAVGNLMPAVMESSHSNTPLLLLTSDRPHDLRDTGSNQTCDQIKLFGDFVRSFTDLAPPSEHLPKRYLATTLAEAVAKTRFPEGGPVQINCPFPEPFFAIEQGDEKPLPTLPTRSIFPSLVLGEKEIDQIAEKLFGVEKGVLLVGSEPHLDRAAAEALGDHLGWPVLGDILSPCRPLAHFPYIFDAFPEKEVDLVLHIGNPIVSKSLLTWLKGTGPKEIMHLSSSSRRTDPFHKVTCRIVADPTKLCLSLCARGRKKSSLWLEEWSELSQRVAGHLAPYLDPAHLTEISLNRLIQEIDTPLFIGNSMPIRNADLFFSSSSDKKKLYANRGLSGIDGNIATCCGIADVHPLVAVIGDQTFLHDLNSLSMLKSCAHPLTLIVVNNGGGGIFSHMPIGDKREHLDAYFAAAHSWEFSHAASLFGLTYQKIREGAELQATLREKETQIIEVTTSREESYLLHKRIKKELVSVLHQPLLYR